MAKSLTRNDTRHSLFGNPAKFPSSQLLLKKRSIFAFRIPSIPNHSARKYSSNSEIAKLVSKDVMDIWNRATIPTITESGVQKKILSLIRNTRDFSRTSGERKTRDSCTSKVCEYDLTFDICLCPCFKQVNSYSDINFTREMCQCSPKIPLNTIDLKFHFDQIGKRLKYIGPVNVPETRLNISRMNRKEHEKDRSDREFEINETFTP